MRRWHEERDLMLRRWRQELGNHTGGFIGPVGLMNNLRYQLRLINRHRRYSGKCAALSFAIRHWRFWYWGAPPPDEEYTHIGGS